MESLILLEIYIIIIINILFKNNTNLIIKILYIYIMNIIIFILLILSYILQYINAKHLLDNNNNNEIYYNIALTNIIILSIATFFTIIILIIFFNLEITNLIYHIITIIFIFITICNILSCTTSVILITENYKDMSKIIPAIIYLSIIFIILLQKIINPTFIMEENFYLQIYTI